MKNKLRMFDDAILYMVYLCKAFDNNDIPVNFDNVL